MYQAFLEPWQEGTLTDVGNQAGRNGAPQKINVKNTVWIITSNWGTEEILKFAEQNKARVYGTIVKEDVEWVHKELVQKQLQDLVLKQFKSVNKELQALARRIDALVPFLPLTKAQQVVVADTAMRQRLMVYRLPAVLKGDATKKRLLGNAKVRHTRGLAKYAASTYDPMDVRDAAFEPYPYPYPKTYSNPIGLVLWPYPYP